MRKSIVLMASILLALFCFVFMGYAQDEKSEKELLNDYYKNTEFKNIVDHIIKSYGGEEQLKAIHYSYLEASLIHTHDSESSLYEVSLYSCLTDSNITKYRRVDYYENLSELVDYKGPKDSQRKLMSGITYNGVELRPLMGISMGTIGLDQMVSRLFDQRYSLLTAFTLRLKDPDYYISYKGKQMDKELNKNVLMVELKDKDTETRKNRTTTLYYNPSTYLLEAIIFKMIIFPDRASAVPAQEVKLLVKGHTSGAIMCDGMCDSMCDSKGFTYISKLSGKDWREFGFSDIKIEKVSFKPFNEDIFDQSNVPKPTETAKELYTQYMNAARADDNETAKLKLYQIVFYYPDDPLASKAKPALDRLKTSSPH
ncbi:MAG: hypothetical protein V1709_05710 [Planctomycetota bacterium]